MIKNVTTKNFELTFSFKPSLFKLELDNDIMLNSCHLKRWICLTLAIIRVLNGLCACVVHVRARMKRQMDAVKEEKCEKVYHKIYFTATNAFSFWRNHNTNNPVIAEYHFNAIEEYIHVVFVCSSLKNNSEISKSRIPL